MDEVFWFLVCLLLTALVMALMLLIAAGMFVFYAVLYGLRLIGWLLGSGRRRTRNASR